MAAIGSKQQILEAEENLNKLSNNEFTQLRSYARPPLCVVALTEAIGTLLDPSKETWDWDDDKKLMAGGKNAFIELLVKLDKDNISDKQLAKVQSILARDDCEPSRLQSISPICAALGVWLRAVVAYATQNK